MEGLQREHLTAVLAVEASAFNGDRPAVLPEESIADYDVVINRRPGAAVVYGFRATALAAGGRFAEALADCETRLRLTPGDPAEGCSSVERAVGVEAEGGSRWLQRSASSRSCGTPSQDW